MGTNKKKNVNIYVKKKIRYLLLQRLHMKLETQKQIAQKLNLDIHLDRFS